MNLNPNISSKNAGFTTPKGYFDELDNRLLKKVTTTPSKNSFPTSAGFGIPEAYFEEVESNIRKKTTSPSKIKVIAMWHQHFAKIAAILVLAMASYTLLQLNKSRNTLDSFSEISDEDLEQYIEKNILPYSEMRNLYLTESEFDIAETNLGGLQEEVILDYLDNELEDLELLED